MILEHDLDSMVDQLNFALNQEFDLAKIEKKYVQSIKIKRSGKMFVISFWYGRRFEIKAKVIKT